jgi:cation:H+ antiporter
MGVIIVAIYPLFIFYYIRNRSCSSPEECTGSKPRLRKRDIDILLGASALVISTFLLVFCTLNLSTIFRLGQFYVGLTIVALGCVVPEVEVSVAATLAGEQEITIGTFIGDNMLTLTLVFGIVGLTSLFSVSLSEVLLTAPFMVIAAFILFAMNKMDQNVNRIWGIMMLLTESVAFIF